MKQDEQIQCVLDLTARVAKKVIEEIKAGEIPAYWGEKQIAGAILATMMDERRSKDHPQR